jgi:hypothetical protein
VIYPVLEGEDEEMVEFDPNSLTNDPGTIYEAASKIFTKISLT